jgi:hypothetical protein
MHLLKAQHPHVPDSQQSGRVMIYVWHCPPVMPGVESVGKVIFVILLSQKSNACQSGNGPTGLFVGTRQTHE